MPATTVDAAFIRDAVRLACRAPSLHNSQPWRLEVERDTVSVFADRDRIVRATDRSGREALIACGALIDHFRVAMAAAGFKANVVRFPNPDNLLHVASVDFAPMEFVTDGHRQRANAILLRRTDRLPFAAPPAWDAFELELHDAAASAAVRLDVIADDLRPQLAEASQLTESLRLYDSPYHSELDWWTAAFEVTDGIPHSSLVSAAESDRVDVGRTFPIINHRERRLEVGDDRSRVLVLSTYDDTHESVLRCGELLSAVLLDATMVGLATCTLTHITEVAAGRKIVAGLIDQGDQGITPQVLVRVGLTPSIEDVPPPTPRRPIGDVFDIRRETNPYNAKVESTGATMGDHFSPSPAVVVGIDGSRSALDAALWAADEALSRDVPLRLVYAIDPGDAAGSDREAAARDLAKAEVAVRYAFAAVESTDKPVKIEVEILQDRPTRALIEASRSAALVCVGSVGLKHSAQGRMGSTAAALASSSHCPVAVIRGHDPFQAERQWVVAELDRSPASEGVLRRAFEEAQLRGVPLRVLTAWQLRFTDIHDGGAVADGTRLAEAHLDRRLAKWKKRYADVDVRAVAVHGSTLNFLTENARSIQLLVVGRERPHGITEPAGPPGYAALHNAACSVLICETQNIL